MKENEKHLLSYFILLTGLFVFFVMFISLSKTRHDQITVAFSGCLFYVLWGIIHHAFEHRFKLAVLLEYVLIGTLAFSALYFVLSL